MREDPVELFFGCGSGDDLPARQDAPRPMLCLVGEAGGLVHGIADDGVLLASRVANVARRDFSR